MLLLTIAAAVALFLLRSKGFRPAITWLGISYTVFNLVFFNYLYPALYRNNPLSKTIHEVRKYEKVVAYKIFQPAFTFYLPQRVPVFESADSLQGYLEKNRALVITREALLPEIDSVRPHGNALSRSG